EAQQRVAREKYAVLHSSYYGPKDTGWHGPINTERQPADLKKYCDRVIEATRASEFGKRRIGFGPLGTKDFDNRILAPLREALEELRDAGALCMRTGPMGPEGNWDKWLEEEQKWQDGAAAAGMYCCPWLKELSAIKQGETEKEQKLKKLIDRFKTHPGMGIWK